MSLFEKYPYTNFHELNLDWIIRRMKDVDHIVKDFTAFNSLKWSGLWDPSKAYTKWSIVQDADGNGYVAIEPVPYNVPLDNTAYWQQVAGYDALFAAYESRISALEAESLYTGKAFDCVPDMLACPDLEDGAIVYVLGNHAANDGGAGFWKISAVDDAAHYSVAYNDMYAIMIDENIFNLARYPGKYVNEMMDAARPYFFAHRWKKIYLPEPNAYNEACSYYMENGHECYYWLVSAPVLFDESCAYSVVEFCGSLTPANPVECVIKVSDPAKPEDIYFVGHTVFGGYHIGPVANWIIPEHALLVEGSARLSFEFLQAGYCQNVITLGGNNQNNTVEVEIVRAEIGSWYNNAINGVLNNATGIFKCMDLVIQYPLGPNIELLHGEGKVFGWNIGQLQYSEAGNPQAGCVPFNFNTDNYAGGAGGSEYVLYIGAARIAGERIGYFGNSGQFYIGMMIGTFGANDPRSLDINNNARVIIGYIGIRNTDFTINNNGQYGTCIIQQAVPQPIITGNNVMIGGLVSDGAITPSSMPNGLILDRSTGKLTAYAHGSIFPIN